MIQELASDELLRLLVGKEGRDASTLKKILVEYHNHTILSAEKVMQHAVERGVLELGDRLKLRVSKKTNAFLEIAKKREAIEAKQKTLNEDLKRLQSECNHGGNLTYTYNGSSGNWSPSDDSYWIEWTCHDCGKRWSTAQTYDEVLKYPNAKEVKKY